MGTKQRSNFFVQRFMLRVAGISLNENESKTYAIVSLIHNFIICAYPFIALTDVFRQDFTTGADLLQYEFIYIVAAIKVMFVRWKRIKLGKFLCKLEPQYLDHLRRKNHKTEKLMRMGYLIATYQAVAYWGLAVVVYSANFIFCLLKNRQYSEFKDKQFMYGSYNLANGIYSPKFELLWGIQSFCCFFLGSQFVMIDATMGAVLCYICFELKILQTNLKEIVENKKMEEPVKEIVPVANTSGTSDNIEDSITEWKYLHPSLKQSVEYHLAILSLVAELNETFSSLLLMTFIGTLGMLTLMVYKVSLIPLNDIRLITSFSEIGVVIVQVLIICFWSDEMMAEGAEVGAAAYGSNFVGTDLRLQKGLVLIMLRSQTLLTLGAGKFADIRLSTFVWIVRSAYSVFTVLRNKNSGN